MAHFRPNHPLDWAKDGILGLAVTVQGGKEKQVSELSLEEYEIRQRLVFDKLQFPHPERIIFLFEGGSKLYGTSLDGNSDSDIYGVFVEAPEQILGLDTFEHFNKTANENGRGNSSPEDVDICLHSLRKFASLVVKGNPTALGFLFAPPVFQHYLWSRISIASRHFIARSHIGAFLGYANAQRRRMENAETYDHKFAMHYIRMFVEGKELMETGRISYPNLQVDLLRKIRSGGVCMSELLEIGESLEKSMLEAKNCSPLQDTVNRQLISALIAKTYLEFWLERPSNHTSVQRAVTGED